MNKLHTILISFILIFIFSSTNAQQINNKDSFGKRVGYWEEKQGNDVSKGNYSNGLKDGQWVTYNYKLQIKSIENYTLGLKQGVAIEVNDRGQIDSEFYYKNDSLDGTCKTFSYGINPLTTIDYKMGVINGMKRIYYENSGGKLMEESSYVNGEKDGLSSFYSNKGYKIAEYNYSKNSLQGLQKTFYPNNQVMSEQEFVDNLEHGNNTEYYENGVIKSKGSYTKGEMTGQWEYFDENGNKSSSGVYKNDKKDGKWLYFNETGKVIKTEKYSNGVLK